MAAAPVRPFVGAAGAVDPVRTATPTPPSMYTPPPTTFPSQAPEAATRSGKNPIPRTVVKAILLGVVLQAVVFGLTRGLHLQPPTAVALGLGLTVAFYLVVLSMVLGLFVPLTLGR